MHLGLSSTSPKTLQFCKDPQSRDPEATVKCHREPVPMAWYTASWVCGATYVVLGYTRLSRLGLAMWFRGKTAESGRAATKNSAGLPKTKWWKEKQGREDKKLFPVPSKLNTRGIKKKKNHSLIGLTFNGVRGWWLRWYLDLWLRLVKDLAICKYEGSEKKAQI